jgi:hypothetical protein
MLVSVIPSLQLLIGEQPAMDVEIGASAVQELYSRLFSHLIDVFSRYVTFPLFLTPNALGKDQFVDRWRGALVSIRPNEPLVMILDDLHWADQPSFNLLQKIVREGDRAQFIYSPIIYISCAVVPKAGAGRGSFLSPRRVPRQRGDQPRTSVLDVLRGAAQQAHLHHQHLTPGNVVVLGQRHPFCRLSNSNLTFSFFGVYCYSRCVSRM